MIFNENTFTNAYFFIVLFGNIISGFLVFQWPPGMTNFRCLVFSFAAIDDVMNVETLMFRICERVNVS